MTTEERCERSDLLISQCAHCLGHRNPYAERIAAETLAWLGQAEPDLLTAGGVP